MCLVVLIILISNFYNKFYKTELSISVSKHLARIKKISKNSGDHAL